MAPTDTHFATTANSAPYLVPSRVERRRARLHTPRRIIHAHSEDGLLTWSYTSTLREGYSHPEILLTGLDTFLAESILGRLTDQVARGIVLGEASLERNLLHRLTCAFREVPGAMASVLMPLADSIVDGQAITALQCIYPDSHNRLPWQPGYDNSWQQVQPIFTFERPMNKAEINLLRAAAGVGETTVLHRVEEAV